jgi:sugar lactone lactonase YvrE
MRIGVRSQSIAIYLAASLLAVSGAALAQAPTFLPTLVTVAGNRTSGYSGDGQLATTAEVGNTISAGTMDPAGNIYIADTKNNVIRKVTPAGIISTFAGLAPGFAVCAGATDAVGDGCLATNASMNAPGSVRYHQGGIYITDFNNGRIRRVDLITNMIATIAGGGTLSLNNANPSNPGTSIAVPQPQDTVFDNLGNMYWTQGGGTSRVDVLNLVTGIAYIFAGDGGTTGATGTEISAAGSGRTSPENTAFNGPQGLAVDAQNNVYVVEYSTKVIRKITVGAVPTLSTYAGIGTSGTITICGGATNSLGDGCPGPNAAFGTIEHMSIDGNGVIYVADSTNNRIRVIQPNPSNLAVGGTVSTLIGNGTAADSPDGTYAAEATIGTPYDSQILPNGDLLLIDRVSSLVRILHNPGAFLSTSLGSTTTEPFNVLTQAGTGTVTLPGATDFNSTTAPTCAAAVGLTGSVCSFNASFKPTLAGFRTNQMQFTDANGTAVVGVSGVGVAPVASLLPGLTSTVAGTGISGATGDGAAAAMATFTTPAAMTTDSQGNVYVADSAANEVRKFTPGGTITRIAGTGAAGSSGDGGAATAATLTSPGGVAVDPAGNVYIADTGNNKIRMVSAANGIINTIAGTGTAGYTGDQSTPITATLTAPTQLAWSPLGILYVADTGNSAVRAIALSESLITTAAGSANPGFDGDGGPGQSAQLLNPSGVAVDANNDVYIADTGNNRVRQLTQGYINTIAGQTGAGYSGDGVASTAELNAPATCTLRIRATRESG